MSDLPVLESKPSHPQLADTKTEVGSYFVSNYPPFSQWKKESVGDIHAALDREPDRSIPLGMYLHIPFCRKRCRFCYFRVYTQQNADMVKNYVDSLDHEVRLLKDLPAIKDRELQFVYFGGGTPSYLSAKQLQMLRSRLSESVSWDNAKEVTFECEPGTLSLEKVQTLKDIGVTRVSLGVENFNDKILEENGRAHLSPEIFKAYGWLKDVDRTSILLVVFGAFSVGAANGVWSQTSVGAVLGLVVTCIALLAAAMGWAAALGRVAGLDRPARIALLFCGSNKSLATGLPMASVLFSGSHVALLVLPLMIYHQSQIIAGGILAGRLARGGLPG